jgi:hypothetical protein
MRDLRKQHERKWIVRGFLWERIFRDDDDDDDERYMVVVVAETIFLMFSSSALVASTTDITRNVATLNRSLYENPRMHASSRRMTIGTPLYHTLLLRLEKRDDEAVMSFGDHRPP